MSNNVSNVGAYGSLLLPEEFPLQMVAAFEVMHSIVGVDYKPLAGQQQVVAGMNYVYFCRAQPVYPDAEAYMAKVHIFVSLPDQEGKVHYSITEIERVAP
ncbi:MULTISPECIES: hypothetical protein [Photobacterium]|uniref:Uncharacterized protein n=1 Tax=Photobacterium alginatilyticum TaxID=1775171 RepID=A0ABW9YDY9_9GAMM|nr:hypothetical protein [Photobacterium alginatilyticum]NBI51938.1 hypothetical protein [Photobacterium alginatilyticum]